MVQCVDYNCERVNFSKLMRRFDPIGKGPCMQPSSTWSFSYLLVVLPLIFSPTYSPHAVSSHPWGTIHNECVCQRAQMQTMRVEFFLEFGVDTAFRNTANKLQHEA